MDSVIKIDLETFDSFNPQRHPMALLMSEEVSWYVAKNVPAIGTVLRDLADDDFSYVVLMPDKNELMRCMSHKGSMDNQKEAEISLVQRMKEINESGLQVFEQEDEDEYEEAHSEEEGWQPEGIRFDELDHLRQYSLVARRFAERLAQRIDSETEKKGDGVRLMPLPWLYPESEYNPEALLLFDSTKMVIRQYAVLNYAVSIPLRCYLGFQTSQEDQFVQGIGTSLVSNFAKLSAQAMLTTSDKQTVMDENYLEKFAEMLNLSSFIASQIQSSDIKRIIKELPFDVCLTAIKRNFRICRDQIATEAFEVASTNQDQSVIDYWATRVAEELWICELIDGQSSQPVPIHPLCETKVKSVLNTLRNANQSHDDLLQQDLSQSCMRNESTPDLLMLLGFPEFDRVIPTLHPLRVSKDTSTNIRTAWKVWSALLHDDEMPEYSATVLNIVRAVEDEFLHLFFEPFFGTDIIKNIKLNEAEIKFIEASGPNGFGLRWIHKLQKQWPETMPSAGDMSSMLSYGIKDILPNNSELSVQWKSFCMSRWAVIRPSLLTDLKLFADLRNPKIHGGRGMTDRDKAIVHRGMGWCLLRAVSKLHVIPPGSEWRYSVEKREEILIEKGWTKDCIEKVKYWEESLPDAKVWIPEIHLD